MHPTKPAGLFETAFCISFAKRLGDDRGSQYVFRSENINAWKPLRQYASSLPLIERDHGVAVNGDRYRSSLAIPKTVGR